MKNSKKILTILLVCLSCVFVSSCKDDDEGSALSFQGEIKFDIPSYAVAGDTIHVNVSEVKRVDEDKSTDGIGYFWILQPVNTKSDTLRDESTPLNVKPNFSFVVPDTLLSLILTCQAFADGYLNTNHSETMVVVDPHMYGKSITGREYKDDDSYFIDPRDGKKYYYTTIEGTSWMRVNLAYEGSGFPYDGHELLSDMIGRYYTWDEAMEACPEGWRLPSDEDWVNAAESAEEGRDFSKGQIFRDIAGHFMQNVSINGIRMWEYWPNVPVTNTLNLDIIPFGLASKINEDYYDFSNVEKNDEYAYAAFWTSDSYNEDNAIYRYISNDAYNDIYAGIGYKNSIATPIRCVRDEN